MTMSGHPERFGWIKCSGCGAHRPPDRIATANGTIAGVCMEGCAPLKPEEDTRRELRHGRYPNDPVEGPVVGTVAAPASISSVSAPSGHCEWCRAPLGDGTCDNCLRTRGLVTT